MKAFHRLIAGAVLAGAGFMPAMAADQPSSRAARGHAFAQAHCARCHAIGTEGDSPLAVAPPFRSLRERFVLDWLEQAFAEGIGVGHRDARFMPEIVLSKPETDDLVAYLATLAQPAE